MYPCTHSFRHVGVRDYGERLFRLWLDRRRLKGLFVFEEERPKSEEQHFGD